MVNPWRNRCHELFTEVTISVARTTITIKAMKFLKVMVLIAQLTFTAIKLWIPLYNFAKCVERNYFGKKDVPTLMVILR